MQDKNVVTCFRKIARYLLIKLPFLNSVRNFPESYSRWKYSRKQRRKMLKFYRMFIVENDLCFDVGANNGNRVEVFSRLGAHVVAIEPQENCVNKLKEKLGKNRNVTIIQKGLGAEDGEKELWIGAEDTISSMSPGWIDAVKKSGRFVSRGWNQKVMVTVTTLDRLIQIYGVPKFIKIDVEGYEYEVISGLTQVVNFISFEFTSEVLNKSFEVINHLESIAKCSYNYSLGESMRLNLKNWVYADDLLEDLRKLEGSLEFGDVYVSFNEKPAL